MDGGYNKIEAFEDILIIIKTAVRKNVALNTFKDDKVGGHTVEPVNEFPLPLEIVLP